MDSGVTDIEFRGYEYVQWPKYSSTPENVWKYP